MPEAFAAYGVSGWWNDGLVDDVCMALPGLWRHARVDVIQPNSRSCATVVFVGRDVRASVASSETYVPAPRARDLVCAFVLRLAVI